MGEISKSEIIGESSTQEPPLLKIEGLPNVLQFYSRLSVSDRKSLLDFDSERRFIIKFYPLDSTLSVYEIELPNSGHQGGKYIDRHAVYSKGTGSKVCV